VRSTVTTVVAAAQLSREIRRRDAQVRVVRASARIELNQGLCRQAESPQVVARRPSRSTRCADSAPDCWSTVARNRALYGKVRVISFAVHDDVVLAFATAVPLDYQEVVAHGRVAHQRCIEHSLHATCPTVVAPDHFCTEPILRTWVCLVDDQERVKLTVTAMQNDSVESENKIPEAHKRWKCR
jgi:hypothetical protein